MRARDVIKTLDRMAGTSIELEAAIVHTSPRKSGLVTAGKLNSIFHQAGLNNAEMPDRDCDHRQRLFRVLPDLPGCVATGKPGEGVRFPNAGSHCFSLEALERNGDPIPEPQGFSAYVEVPA
jgi:hypothetical protein